MIDRTARPKNRRRFDFHHEKVALTQLGHWLKAHGWDDVWPSVHPDDVFGPGPKDPVPLQTLDQAFIDRFNSESEELWRTRYTFYRDQPRHYDLVARREGEVLIVDGKGRSVSNKRGAVAQMIGGHVLARRQTLPNVKYAIVIPGRSESDPETGSPSQVRLENARVDTWDGALTNNGGLDWIQIYRVSRLHGLVVEDNWDRYRAPDGRLPDAP